MDADGTAAAASAGAGANHAMAALQLTVLSGASSASAADSSSSRAPSEAARRAREALSLRVSLGTLELPPPLVQAWLALQEACVREVRADLEGCVALEQAAKAEADGVGAAGSSGKVGAILAEPIGSMMALYEHGMRARNLAKGEVERLASLVDKSRQALATAPRWSARPAPAAPGTMVVNASSFGRGGLSGDAPFAELIACVLPSRIADLASALAREWAKWMAVRVPPQPKGTEGQLLTLLAAAQGQAKRRLVALAAEASGIVRQRDTLAAAVAALKTHAASTLAAGADASAEEDVARARYQRLQKLRKKKRAALRKKKLAAAGDAAEALAPSLTDAALDAEVDIAALERELEAEDAREREELRRELQTVAQRMVADDYQCAREEELRSLCRAQSEAVMAERERGKAEMAQLMAQLEPSVRYAEEKERQAFRHAAEIARARARVAEMQDRIAGSDGLLRLKGDVARLMTTVPVLSSAPEHGATHTILHASLAAALAQAPFSAELHALLREVRRDLEMFAAARRRDEHPGLVPVTANTGTFAASVSPHEPLALHPGTQAGAAVSLALPTIHMLRCVFEAHAGSIVVQNPPTLPAPRLPVIPAPSAADEANVSHAIRARLRRHSPGPVHVGSRVSDAMAASTSDLTAAFSAAVSPAHAHLMQRQQSKESFPPVAPKPLTLDFSAVRKAFESHVQAGQDGTDAATATARSLGIAPSPAVSKAATPTLRLSLAAAALAAITGPAEDTSAARKPATPSAARSRSLWEQVLSPVPAGRPSGEDVESTPEPAAAAESDQAPVASRAAPLAMDADGAAFLASLLKTLPELEGVAHGVVSPSQAMTAVLSALSRMQTNNAAIVPVPAAAAAPSAPSPAPEEQKGSQVPRPTAAAPAPAAAASQKFGVAALSMQAAIPQAAAMTSASSAILSVKPAATSRLLGPDRRRALIAAIEEDSAPSAPAPAPVPVRAAAPVPAPVQHQRAGHRREPSAPSLVLPLVTVRQPKRPMDLGGSRVEGVSRTDDDAVSETSDGSSEVRDIVTGQNTGANARLSWNASEIAEQRRRAEQLEAEQQHQQHMRARSKSPMSSSLSVTTGSTASDSGELSGSTRVRFREVVDIAVVARQIPGDPDSVSPALKGPSDAFSAGGSQSSGAGAMTTAMQDSDGEASDSPDGSGRSRQNQRIQRFSARRKLSSEYYRYQELLRDPEPSTGSSDESNSSGSHHNSSADPRSNDGSRQDEEDDEEPTTAASPAWASAWSELYKSAPAPKPAGSNEGAKRSAMRRATPAQHPSALESPNMMLPPTPMHRF
jgi:hypothetical protein